MAYRNRVRHLLSGQEQGINLSAKQSDEIQQRVEQIKKAADDSDHALQSPGFKTVLVPFIMLT